jgi:hypothetical protein
LKPSTIISRFKGTSIFPIDPLVMDKYFGPSKGYLQTTQEGDEHNFEDEVMFEEEANTYTQKDDDNIEDLVNTQDEDLVNTQELVNNCEGLVQYNIGSHLEETEEYLANFIIWDSMLVEISPFTLENCGLDAKLITDKEVEGLQPMKFLSGIVIDFYMK